MPTIPPDASTAEIAQIISDQIDRYLEAHGITVTYRAQLGWMDVEPEVNVAFFGLHFADAVLFTNDFAGSAGAVKGAAPSAAYAITVKIMAPGSLVETTVGTITLNTDRTVSFETSGGDLAVPAGSTLLFYSAGTKRGAARVFLLLRGSYVA
jgi:hypothetical protein